MPLFSDDAFVPPPPPPAAGAPAVPPPPPAPPREAVNCFICSRKLTDDESRRVGVGPVCREQSGYEQLSPETKARLFEAALVTGRGARRAVARELAGVSDAAPMLVKALRRAGMLDERRAPDARTDVEQVRLGGQIRIEGNPVIEGARRVLTDHQQPTLNAALRVIQGEVDGAVIEGFAGVGKSFVYTKIAEVLGDGDPSRVPVLAPTGKAALRLRKDGLEGARTIHRWCYRAEEDPRTGQIVFRRAVPTDVPRYGTLLVDEASMIGPDLSADLAWAAAAVKARIIVAGDGFQLPPIAPKGAAKVKSLLETHVGPRVMLTEIMRQKAGNPVIEAGALLRKGQHREALEILPSVAMKRAAEACEVVTSGGGIVIVHRNQTRQAVNRMIRRNRGLPENDVTPGEPLLVLKNDYQVDAYNGESVTFVRWEVPPDPASKGWLVRDMWTKTEARVHFGLALIRVRDGDPVAVVLALEHVWGLVEQMKLGGKALSLAAWEWAQRHAGEWHDEIEVYDRETGDYVMRSVPPPYLEANFGYAYTCHKMQGSQARNVLVVIEPTVKLQTEEGRRWCYTAITRAERTAAITHVPWGWP